MAEFQPGEVVNITIKAVRVASQFSDGSIQVLDEHNNCYGMPPQAAIERVAPAEWPPQSGDLWRSATGTAWFAADMHDPADTDKPDIVMVAAHGERREPAELLQDDGLILVHREEAAADA